MTLKTPLAPGSYSLKAIATAEDDSAHPVISRREVMVRQVAAEK
jgi:hypothetical protein